MQNRKLMAVLSLLFILIGTVLATIVTIDYRGNADKLRNRIDSLTAENNSINKRNEGLNKAIDTTTSKNQKLMNHNIEITESNQKLVKSNLSLTKRVEDLGKLTFEKAKKLQYPISDEFSISYSFTFKKDNFIKMLSPEERKRFHFFSLSLPKKFERVPESVLDILTDKFKEIFAKGYINLEFRKGSTTFNLKKSYNEEDIFDKHIINNINRGLPYRNPKAHVFLQENDDLFKFEFKNLPMRITLNSGNYSSVLDLQNSELFVHISSYADIQDVSFNGLWLEMENQMLLGVSNFKYNAEIGEYISADKVNLRIK